MSGTVATAKFPAAFVRDRAIELIAENETKMAEAVEEAVQAGLKTPVKRGFLFWKRDHYRTRAEVEADLVKPSEYMGYFGSVEWKIKRRFDGRIGALSSIKRLAGAAAQHGADGFVTLTADDCSWLNIPTEQAA